MGLVNCDVPDDLSSTAMPFNASYTPKGKDSVKYIFAANYGYIVKLYNTRTPPASARSGISVLIRFRNASYVEASILATPSTSVPGAVTSPSSPTDAILASAPPVP